MLLAVDPGQTTGAARSDGTTGSFTVKRIADHGQALALFSDWLDDELEQHRPKRIAIERAFFHRPGALSDLTTAMIAVAHMAAWTHNVPRCEHPASQVRDWLLGPRKERNGWSDKKLDRAILEAVEARGFRCETPHAADAAALLSYVERRPVMHLVGGRVAA